MSNPMTDHPPADAERRTIAITIGPRRIRLDWGGLIRWGREAKDLSMPDLARRLGVTPKTVQNWEIRGTTPMRCNMRERIARELFEPGTEEYRMILEG